MLRYYVRHSSIFVGCLRCDGCDMIDDYDFWRRALAGEKIGGADLQVHESEPCCGFFRKRSGPGTPFERVAIWRADGQLVATVGKNAVDPAEIWTYCCTRPVTEAQYREHEATGRWFDEDSAVTASLAHDTRNSSTDPAEALKDQIDAALAGATDYAEITTDEQAAKGQGLRSRLLELSGDADKEREAQKRPHFEAGKAVDAKFQPLVKAAKAGADAIRAALGAFETAKARERARLQAIADEAERVRLAEEAKAAAKAAKKGQPAPEPAPPPPAPEPAPAVSETIRGGYGRGAAVIVKRRATVIDQDAAYLALKTRPELVELIAKLAQRATDAGIEVAGVTVEEIRDVR